MEINMIGLDKEKSAELARKLNALLANYSVFYQNARGFHWNIKGEKFFELHLKFEELYNNLFTKIDEIAERILTLGYSPDHKFTGYLGSSEIKETEKISNGIDAVRMIVYSYKSLILMQRAILSLSAEISDEGTSALMSDYIREQEKTVWMYSSYLQ